MHSDQLEAVRVRCGDVTLPVTGVHRGDDGFHHILCAGSHEGVVAGFEIVLVPGWPSRKVDDSLSLHFGTVRILSLGNPSDAFIRLLKRTWQSKLHCDSMRAVTEYTAVTLGGDPDSLESGPVRIKLFYEGETEDLDAQIFLDLDLPGREVTLAEKDSDFRRRVLLSLSRPAGPQRATTAGD